MTVIDAPLSGRHALVTGANRGIGAAVARTLSRAGASVTLLVRDASSAQAVTSSLRGAHSVVVADVTHPEATRAACAAAVAALGPVDILVNNAGFAESAPFLRTDAAMFARMIDVHLMGAVHTTQALLPSMLERAFGRVINMASVAGLGGAAYITAYSSAKHALVGLTRSLAAEVAMRGVAVHAVCPGYTDTDLVQAAVERIVRKTGRSDEDALRSILADAKQSRIISVSEVADAVLALCVAPPDAPTGQIIVLDGGAVS